MGSLDATANVLGGGKAASVCVGACSIPTKTPTTPAAAPPVAAPNTSMNARRLAKLAHKCLQSGNTDAFNGFGLVDRKGVTLGWVQAAEIDRNQKIARLSFVGKNEKCMRLTGGNFRIIGDQLRLN